MKTQTDVGQPSATMDRPLDSREVGESPGRWSQTRLSILNAAKELVARKGANGTTVRDITAASGANGAAVNYYFQSKDALVRRAILDITGDVNRERLARLDALEQRAAGKPLRPRQILAALIEPIIDVSRAEDGGSLYVRCMFQMRIDAHAAYESFDLNANVARRFLDAIRRALPSLTHEQAIWNYEFARGAATHLLANLDPESRRFELLAVDTGKKLPVRPAYNLDQAQVDRVIDLILGGFAQKPSAAR